MTYANLCFASNNYKKLLKYNRNSKTGKHKERNHFSNIGPCLNPHVNSKSDQYNKDTNGVIPSKWSMENLKNWTAY